MGARRRRVNPYWQALSANPLRLLAFAAVIELLLLILALLLHRQGAELRFSLPPDKLAAVVLLLIVLPSFFSGVLMQFYPRWLRGEAPRYVRYGSVFFLSTAGSLLFLTGMLFAGALIWLGLAMLFFAWLVGVRTLWHIYSWAPNPERGRERIINASLLVGSGGGMAAGAGLLYELPWLLQWGLLVVLSAQVLLSLVLLLHLWGRGGRL
jgi:hypothetical protein